MRKFVAVCCGMFLVSIVISCVEQEVRTGMATDASIPSASASVSASSSASTETLMSVLPSVDSGVADVQAEK